MKKIRILFYKSKVGDGHWIDNGISLWTKLFNWRTKNYSHVEVWWANEKGNFEEPEVDDAYDPTGKWVFVGQCFTSTMRGKENGTVIRDASEVLKNPGRWDVAEIEIVSTFRIGRAKLYAELEAKENKGYDKLCIADFFNPFRRWIRLHAKDKNICSEAGDKFLLWCGIFCKLTQPSPRRLSRKLIEKGYKIRPLRS